MVNTLLRANEKTLLPFAISSQTNQVFNDDVEKAAVFCIADLNRATGGGFFRKQAAEKIIFISKVYYPFWLVPFREWTLLLDGLRVATHIITYPALPDLKSFKENLNECTMSCQVHANFLSNNQNYFQAGVEQKIDVEGLLNDSEFTTEFLNSSREATSTASPIVDAVLITPGLDEPEVLRMLQNVDNARLNLIDELACLNEIIKLLNSKAQESQAILRKEIIATEKIFSVQIPKIKSILESKVAKINKEYSGEVHRVSNKFEQKITVLQKDVLKLEKIKSQLDDEIEHVEREIKTSAINKNEAAEKKWKEKHNELKDKLPLLTSRFKQLEKQIREIEDNRKNQLFQLRHDSDDRIKEASKDLIEIEAARDAEIKICQNEMEKIEELTSNIIKKVDELAKNREAVLLEFDELGIRLQRVEFSLIYMPFYLFCYQSKSDKRYIYLAPSSVSDCNLGTKLKSVGKKRINQLFQPRYKKSISILNGFIELLNENIVFSHEISDACSRASLLTKEKAQEEVIRGLISLKEQKWLSNSEFESFNKEVPQFFR